ncbi:MAG: hypothetical protein ACYTFI_23835 [Planctomycetota bacterium]|jgi:hypothetical protein
MARGACQARRSGRSLGPAAHRSGRKSGDAVTVTKHGIKRTSRFISSDRVDVAEGCRGLVGLAAKAGGGDLVIAADRVDMR